MKISTNNRFFWELYHISGGKTTVFPKADERKKLFSKSPLYKNEKPCYNNRAENANAPVAQWIEHRIPVPRVGGSSPFRRTIKRDIPKWDIPFNLYEEGIRHPLILYLLNKILIKQHTLTDVLDGDVLVFAVDGGELFPAQVDGGKAQNGICDIGKTPGICTCG